MSGLSLAHCHATRTEVGFDVPKDLLAQITLLQQVAEGLERRFVWDLTCYQIVVGNRHGGCLDQGFFYSWIAEQIALMQEVNPEHGGQWYGAQPFLIVLGWLGSIKAIKDTRVRPLPSQKDIFRV